MLRRLLVQTDSQELHASPGERIRIVVGVLLVTLCGFLLVAALLLQWHPKLAILLLLGLTSGVFLLLSGTAGRDSQAPPLKHGCLGALLVLVGQILPYPYGAVMLSGIILFLVFSFGRVGLTLLQLSNSDRDLIDRILEEEHSR
jgi:hypothetical protein